LCVLVGGFAGMIKMSAKIIENVVKDAVGEDILPLVRALKNKKNVSE